MPMPRSSKGRRSNAENSMDFCLAVTNEQIDCPDSSASPRSGVISDCCSFLLGRKSSHGEHDIRAIRNKDQPSLNAVNGVSGSCPQREEISKQRSNHSSAAIKSANPDNSLTCDWQLRQVAEETKTDGDVQRLLKEDAIEATEKQSNNPYLDLRESMLEMMVMITSSYSTTRGYCSEQDDGGVLSSLAATPGKGMISIEDLLYCYLRLNSIDLYELIATAFFDTFSDFVTIYRD
ncbi:hypothetical protein KP509_16G032300 [Ceratopteris richardii]|nr:hypothetical protein KP509_16G032300 [Ceratopteris richardii]